jgi:8-oxo-dGTP pyrophosphatase MutT (NUDIX family)/predicted Fe-S protein YdhL (DUF1289 family)
MNSRVAILSPCIGVCRLDPVGYCEGCHRTGSEIAAWMSLDAASRQHYMDEILPARAAAHATHGSEQVAGYRRALHPLSSPPTGLGWNREELSDLLPEPSALVPAAVLIGLVLRVDGWQVMLTLRTEDLRHHAGQVSFPGGRIEAHDVDPIAAALREAQEEIGLAPHQAEPLGYLDPFDTISGFHVYPVVARVATDYRPQLDPREVADVFEVPLDYLMDASNIREVAREYAGKTRRYYEYAFERQRIWGATAAMLVNLRERLESVR